LWEEKLLKLRGRGKRDFPSQQSGKTRQFGVCENKKKEWMGHTKDTSWFGVALGGKLTKPKIM